MEGCEAMKVLKDYQAAAYNEPSNVEKLEQLREKLRAATKCMIACSQIQINIVSQVLPLADNFSIHIKNKDINFTICKSRYQYKLLLLQIVKFKNLCISFDVHNKIGKNDIC